jgi:hypothetical protein
MRLLFLFIILTSVFGCYEKKSNKPEIHSNALIKKDTIVEISIKQIGLLRFRKSYADGQVREVSDKELELMKRANPTAEYVNDTALTALTKRFQQLKLVKGYEFLEKKFKTYRLLNYDHPEVLFELYGLNGGKLNCRFIKKENKYSLIVSDNARTSKIEVDGFYIDDLKFMLWDIVPGGYKEIVVLNEYYIMNGDNSHIYVYEVK